MRLPIENSLLATRRHRALKRLCLVVLIASVTGCKSSLPKPNMFGFKREPSAETLAGSGPSTTYPVSPSMGLNPEAIASTAAGAAAPSGLKPQTGNLAGGPSYGQASPQAPATNGAAAAANGFYGAALPATPGSTAPSTNLPAGMVAKTGSSGGFTYGQNPNTTAGQNGGVAAIPAGYTPSRTAPATTLPKYAQAVPTSPQASGPAAPAYTAVPGYPMPGAATTASASAPTKTPPIASAPAAPAVPPAMKTPSMLPSLASAPPTMSAPPTAPGSSSAFELPPIAAMPATTSKPPTSSAGGFALPPTPGIAAAVSAMSAPAASAKIASLRSTPSNKSNLMSPPAPATPAGGGYKPGSTARATGYPTAEYPSTGTSDTFYR